MINDDTNEELKCVICGSVEIYECGHMVACFDNTYCEVESGALYGRDDDFRSEIQNAFLGFLKSKSEIKWANFDLQELWRQAQADLCEQGDDFILEGTNLSGFFVYLFKSSGAIDPGSAAHYGALPGTSYDYSFLYAKSPNAVIKKAMKKLKTILSAPDKL